jgi:hypothetical protein
VPELTKSNGERNGRKGKTQSTQCKTEKPLVLVDQLDQVEEEVGGDL